MMFAAAVFIGVAGAAAAGQAAVHTASAEVWQAEAADILSVAGAIGGRKEEDAQPTEGGEQSGALVRLGRETPVEHFFTHALVAHPELGFDADNEMRVNYDRDCLTPEEFRAILQSLYERGYALTDVCDTYQTKDGVVTRCAYDFPAGKKPLVLSFDDINYYVKKMDKGMNDRMDADESGRLFTYTENAREKVSYDNEVVTIVENFIETHPDFSFRGARGMLCLTGFDGILGYRTQSGSDNRTEQIARAKRVVQTLKAKGWRFACHSYGHYHMKKLSVEKFRTDTEKWLREVGAIVGKTDVYVYPYGEWEVAQDGNKCEKHRFLETCGFKLFCGVGERDYYTNMDGCLFMDRKPLDGISLRTLKTVYAPYFDAAAVYDSRRPTPYPD